MKVLSLAVLTLLSSQVSAKICTLDYCIGDQVLNVEPELESEMFGRITSISGHEFDVTWDSGRSVKKSSGYFDYMKNFRNCTEFEGEKICKGDRILMQGPTAEDSIYYAEFLGFSGRYSDGVYGKIVGTNKVKRLSFVRGKTFDDHGTLHYKGVVPGVEDVRFGEPVQNKFGSNDVILGSAGAKYFVYLGNEGVARALFKKDLLKRVENLSASIDPNAQQIGKNCPDFRGEYQDLGCEFEKDKLHFWPYSDDHKFSSKRIVIEQKGCEELKIAYDLKQHVDESSKMTLGAEGKAAIYDLTKARFKGQEASIKISASDYGISGINECLPIPVAYVDKLTQNYKFSLKGNTLETSFKASDFSLTYIIPHLRREKTECEMVRVE